MATKSILVAVTDEKALAEITQALGKEWGVTSVSSEADATAQFEKRAFDALLVDFNLGSPDASELLNQVLEKHPQTIRFLSVYEADLALVAAKVNGTHHILPKPIEAASLRSRIENALKDSGSEPSATDSANAAPESPKISSVYAEVLKALESPNVTNKQVGKILARDAELTAEILKLTNSSYLGLPRNITSPAEAVGALGFETVKAVVMAQQFLAEHKEMVPCYLSLEQIWQHSVNVGQIARDLVLFETKDRALASQALVAGLLHDLGKVVLAKNFEDLYGRVTSLARKQPVALWEVEKEMFGASHGEIGGCLLGMWNLPLAIVDAAALHHEPPLGEHDRLSPLAAVHIANVIERELRPNEDGMMVAPVIHAPFLNEIGLLHRLPVWRAAFANRRAVDLEGGRTARTGNLLQGPAGETETGTWGQTEGIFRNRRNWILAGVTGGLVALALWFRTPSGPDQSDVVYARTPSAQEEVTVAAAKPLPEAAPTVVAPVAVAEEKPAVSARTETISKPAAASQATEVAAAANAPKTAATGQGVQGTRPSEGTAANTQGLAGVRPAEGTAAKAQAPAAARPSDGTVAAVSVPPANIVLERKAQPDFRINGIIYTSHPSAIVNGQMVVVGDQVGNATVLAIAQTSVTLQVNGQRKIYELK